MTTTARTAHADQMHAEVRDARDCDALDPCASCQVKTATVRSARRVARVEAGRVNAVQSMLEQRLAAVR